MKHSYLKHILMCLCLLSGIKTFAYDAEIDGIYYNFSGDEAEVTYLYNNSYDNKNAYWGTVVIPESVTYNNESYNVTSIGNYAFYNCSGLTSITIPNSVTSIGKEAFVSCTGLTSIVIPNSVTSINMYAFQNCRGLTSVTLSNRIKSINQSTFHYCSSLISVTIPDGVTSIGPAAFFRCSSLNSVTIPNSVSDIGADAFHYCSSLTSITIPNSVTSIGYSAFSDCTGLTSITIPNSVTSIESWAFSSCSSLTDVYCYAENVPSTGSFVFNNSPIASVLLHVPAGSVEKYKATAYWSDFGVIVSIGHDANTENVEIATAADLADFAARVNAGETSLCAVLKADINFTTYPDVRIENYQGEFDGAGHSIKLIQNCTSNSAGFFGFLRGYVHDLTTTGTITTSDKFAGGIASQTENAAIERCQSRVNIISSVDGDGTHGGIVGVSHAGSVIRDCLVSGSITGSQTNCCGGVSGWADGTTFISNTLITSDFTVGTTNSDLLSRNSSNVRPSNNYFQGNWGAANDCGVTLLTETQVESGEACFLLNAGRTSDNRVWFQTLDEDDFPIPDNSHLPVWFIEDSYVNPDYYFTITIGGTGFATYCSRYPLDFSGVSGMKAYIASGFNPSSYTLTLTRVTEVPAGEGLYLVGEPGTYEVPFTETNMMYSNLLKGVTTATTISPTDGDYTNFILANGKHGVAFYSLSEAGELAAGKAYLQLPTASVSEVKAISVIFDDDDATGLSLTSTLSKGEGAIYNLQGQQVSQAKSGLYIINGKKVFIR